MPSRRVFWRARSRTDHSICATAPKHPMCGNPASSGEATIRLPTTRARTASWPPSQWPASSPGAASTCSAPSTPTRFTRHPDPSRRRWWSAPPTYTSPVVSRSTPATGVPASIPAGRPSEHRRDRGPTIVGDTQSEMLSPTTSSSSTEVTQDADVDSTQWFSRGGNRPGAGPWQSTR